MIFYKIENYQLYVGMGDKIAKAFAWLNETDLVHTSDGKHEIDHDDIFAIVQEYQTKEMSEARLEGHRRFIDIQYVVEGSELMGVTPLNNQSVEEETTIMTVLFIPASRA